MNEVSSDQTQAPFLVRLRLPHHLCVLAKLNRETVLEFENKPNFGDVLSELETLHPVLRGTIRDVRTAKRRPMLRFFVLEEDWSFREWDSVLPDAIVCGKEPLMVVGAIAGG